MIVLKIVVGLILVSAVVGIVWACWEARCCFIKYKNFYHEDV